MGLTRLDQLYRAVILDHSKDPRHKGQLDRVDAVMALRNPTCGDEIQVQVKLDDQGQVIQDVSFDGQGCTISMASASMMTEAIVGKSLDQVKDLYQTFSDLVQGKEPEQTEDLGDAVMLEGVRQFPSRVRCATLSWKALNKALENTGSGLDENTSEDIYD
ncbi:NifU-like protein [Alloiococcus otitis]|uniref:NifU family SUF system FeS assembly protein n=1 Tax=Alloiococcus otitis ATCC 51267 TaxID=883081 RepID=K9E7H1_9LACT|nr:SUF system NifU family Fe-S cluster assembly protein [Alloiococcus otitis]EKU93144.1 NifU family SUF system FeS assembly protein [Alloiococcus otitis ATCC 51267]SUU80665.1 NifU-like protein [Alloiococcus otitis]